MGQTGPNGARQGLTGQNGAKWGKMGQNGIKRGQTGLIFCMQVYFFEESIMFHASLASKLPHSAEILSYHIMGNDIFRCIHISFLLCDMTIYILFWHLFSYLFIYVPRSCQDRVPHYYLVEAAGWLFHIVQLGPNLTLLKGGGQKRLRASSPLNFEKNNHRTRL